MQLFSAEKGWKHVSVQKGVTLNTCCDIPVATHRNQFFSELPVPTHNRLFSEPPMFGDTQHLLQSDEKFLHLRGNAVTFLGVLARG